MISEGRADVISIQSIMLVALGFLTAALLALMIAPAFWSRAVRLTTRRIKQNLPLTEAEIKADKDRLRAEYAIRVHKLEMRLEQSALQRARDKIEINRREGSISKLEQDYESLKLSVEEQLNARRVLEQTVSDRLPKVEYRLNEAKTLLFNRDREISELTQSSRQQKFALDEASSINAQQIAEIDRLSNALTIRGARNQHALVDPRFEGELALRSEIEALRGKTREQAAVISRLQGQGGRSAGAPLALASPETAPDWPGDADDAGGRATGAPALSLVAGDGRAETDREWRALKSANDDQAVELARLRAELKTLQGGDDDPNNLKDSKMALKARLNAVQAQTDQQGDTIKRLRAELAAANERLALQGAHYMEQMRRLGAGTLPASGQTRRPVSQGARPSLAERITLQRPVVVGASDMAAAVEPATSDPSATPHNGTGNGNGPHEAGNGLDVAAESLSAGDAGARKPRLIDRISSINKV